LILTDVLVLELLVHATRCTLVYKPVFVMRLLMGKCYNSASGVQMSRGSHKSVTIQRNIQI